MSKLFDLNIERVLEHWGPEDAVREIISNALDEQVLSNTQDIEIRENQGVWCIRDYGRGIQYSHFTQNENIEKIRSPELIGKFGVGLKDALAVFYRKNIEVIIDSKYAHISFLMTNKAGFKVETLHAVFDDPKDPNMKGTSVKLKGISEETIEKAKMMFLKFNTLPFLEKTKHGEVYQSKCEMAVIYINGVKVAEEPNFLFSYNITNINKQIKKALNRERSNVGRTAYSDTVKNILKGCKTEKVLSLLVNDLQNQMVGTNHDESGWADVASYAATTLNREGNVVFMTPAQRNNMTNQEVEILQQSNKQLIMLNDTVFNKVQGEVVTFKSVFSNYEKTFKYEFVETSSLSASEQEIFHNKIHILNFLKRCNYDVNVPVKISETIRVDDYGEACNGVFDSSEGAIIIRRSVLNNKEKFLGVLMHEFIHYAKGNEDNTRAFENDLTDVIGLLLFEVIRLKT